MAAVGGWRFARASAPVNGPIVLVSIDALRADRLAAYGYDAGRTPAIAGLAADGMTFDRAYSHVPQTLPAHASLLTGRLPFETGVTDSAGMTLPASTRTVASMLRDRGYATGAVVSSWLLRRSTGIDNGFTFFDASLPPPSNADARISLLREGEDAEQTAEHWLDSVGTPRAFLFLHIAEPHAPYSVPERFADLPPYDGEVAHADEVVGRLLRYLKAHQLYDRATIVLVSDHGEALGDGGEQTHGLLVSEAVLRVPLIIKLPGGEGAGRRVPHVVQHIDLVPTILDLAKAPDGDRLRGRSLTPLFSGDRIAAAVVYSESRFGEYRFGWPRLSTVTDGRYRLTEDDQLFDLETDPAAATDVAADYPEVAARLRESLDMFAASPARSDVTPVTPSDRERYEALGYVGAPSTAERPDGAGTAPAPSDIAFVEAYRRAADLSASRQWGAAIAAFRALVRHRQGDPDLWIHLARAAARAERHDIAIDGYRRVIDLDPSDMAARLGAAASLLRTRRLDDAAEHARAVVSADTAVPVQKAEAHELLARVAINRRDGDTARNEAALAEEADPDRPVRSFVEGRLAMDATRFEDAAAAFDAALATAARTGRPPLTDLRVFAADTLVRLGRIAEAEALFSAELEAFPANPRARSGLQALYKSTGRSADAASLAQH